MSLQSERVQRQIAEIENLRRLILQCNLTKLCAVCHISPVYTIRPGVHSMTCIRMQCKRAWILGEPYRCQACKSLDFERLEMQWDNDGRKLYRCNKCQKTYAIHHRTFEAVIDSEAGEESTQ